MCIGLGMLEEGGQLFIGKDTGIFDGGLMNQRKAVFRTQNRQALEECKSVWLGKGESLC